MVRPTTLLIALAAALLLHLSPAPTLAADDDAALPAIFNGKDLAGWAVPKDNPWWSVQAGGVLLGQQGDHGKGNVLETKKKYHNLVFECEARWGAGANIDSGIFIRAKQRWQCQIGISRSLKRDMTCSIYIPGHGYMRKAHDVDKLLKPGDWNKIRITARDDHFTIDLNGSTVLDTDLPGHNDPGPIGLQIHPGVKMKIEFRNIRAKALD